MPTEKMQFGELSCGFFRYSGKIYFGMPHGNWTFYFPVKNGKISRHSDEANIFPKEEKEEIEVIPLQEIAKHVPEMEGITAENLMDGRFWSSSSPV